MIFEQIRVGGDRNFAYLVGDETSKEAAVIDPSFDPDRVIYRAEQHGLTVKYIIGTHDHFDHTNGNRQAKKRTGAQIVMHRSAGSSCDVPVDDGAELALGSLKLKIIHTPGHTNDGICVLAGNKLATGDTLFVGKVGGTGFGEDARNEYDSLHNKLMVLDDDVEVYPGHDYGVQPTSTIGHEKKTNPFILRESFEDFVDLKRNWLEYKRIHGIA